MYRPASGKTLEGPGRGREASVTPPRTPNNDSTDGRTHAAKLAAILTNPHPRVTPGRKQDGRLARHVRTQKPAGGRVGRESPRGGPSFRPTQVQDRLADFVIQSSTGLPWIPNQD